jgi:hypothetical protein
MSRILVAEFDHPDAILAAAQALRAHGIILGDAYTPYAIPELEPMIAARHSILPTIVFCGGVAGLLAGAATQYWPSAVLYPLNIGGRPLASWPAFGPILFEGTVIGAVLAGFFGFLLLARLPRFYDRRFAAPDFARASSDRFFLAVPLGNGRDARTRVTRLLGASKPVAIHELPP